MFHIGPFRIGSRVLLAPMAGVSDAPFRRICQQMGAGLTTSEMLTADIRLWHSRKSSLRLQGEVPSPENSCGNQLTTGNIADSIWTDSNRTDRSETESSRQTAPRSVQIAGSEGTALAEAAKAAVNDGADIIDINMGCPAKKVCNKAAGSALLRDEPLVTRILQAVVAAVDVPVTLKIRTGWCPANRNGTTIAKIAEDSGIQALAVHGRTRACRFTADAEYETIAAIVRNVRIPVIANGDITSPQKAARVLAETGAQAVMIGRGAQGQPWLIREIDNYLRTGRTIPAPTLVQITTTVAEHLSALYRFYGDHLGVRIARKHVKWYLYKLLERFHRTGIHRTGTGSCLPGTPREQLSGDIKAYLQTFNTINSPDQQHGYVQQIFERLITREDIAA